MAKTRNYRGHEVANYMFGHADQPVSCRTVATEINWTVSAVSSSLSYLLAKYPKQMERTGKGFYRWNSKPVEAEPETPAVVAEMMVTILARKDDGTLLVRDDDDVNGQLYTMHLFTF